VVYSVRQRTSADSDRIGGQEGAHMSDHATEQKEKRWIVDWGFRRLADVLFGHIPIKLPGWVLLLLAVIIAVPDLKSRYDFWLQVALSSGGWWATVATVLLWPYFSATLAIVGVLYLVMVSRPSSGFQQHPLVPIIGWISAALCFIAIVATVGYGATEIYIRTEIAKGLSGVPRTASPSAPNSGADHPLYAGNRNLTPDQQRILISESGKLKDHLQGLPITWLTADYEAFAYAGQIRTALARGAIDSGISEQPLGDPDQNGVMIEVHDPKSPPEAANKLKELFAVADIDAKIVPTLPRFGNTPVILFIGPRPIRR
jgi:hypothetical protein